MSNGTARVTVRRSEIAKDRRRRFVGLFRRFLCVDENLQKLNFGVVFAEANECCSTKKSFYAYIRRRLFDEETNIRYITLGILDKWIFEEKFLID